MGQLEVAIFVVFQQTSSGKIPSLFGAFRVDLKAILQVLLFYKFEFRHWSRSLMVVNPASTLGTFSELG